MDALVGLALMAAAALVLGAQAWTRRRHPRPVTHPQVAARVTGRTAGAGPSATRPTAGQVGRGASRLFGFGSRSTEAAGGYAHDGPYLVVGLTATGLNPARDAVVELALLSTDPAGQILDQYHTLVNPVDRPLGEQRLHGLPEPALRSAPTFADLTALVLDRFDGAVVVSHFGELVEQFLTTELLRTGVLIQAVPALSTFRLGQQTFPVPNLHLATLAGHLGVTGQRPDTALGQARVVAAALPPILARHGAALRYPVAPPLRHHPADRPAPTARVRPRPAPSATRVAWLADLMARLPMSALEANDARMAAYLDMVTRMLTDGRVVTDEVRLVAGQLAAGGNSAGQIAAVGHRLLESIRRTVFDGPALTQTQLRHLRAAATSLGAPSYFDDLVPPPAPPAPEPGSGSFARPVRKPLPPPPAPHLPRCGRCLALGHYTSDCPRRDSGTAVAAIGPIRG